MVEAYSLGHRCFGARERQVNVRVLPAGNAIEGSVDLAHEIYSRVFRKMPERMEQTGKM